MWCRVFPKNLRSVLVSGAVLAGLIVAGELSLAHAQTLQDPAKVVSIQLFGYPVPGSYNQHNTILNLYAITDKNGKPAVFVDGNQGGGFPDGVFFSNSPDQAKTVAPVTMVLGKGTATTQQVTYTTSGRFLDWKTYPNLTPVPVQIKVFVTITATGWPNFPSPGGKSVRACTATMIAFDAKTGKPIYKSPPLNGTSIALP